MRCEVCGSHIPINQSECPNCGYKIKEAVTLRKEAHTFKKPKYLQALIKIIIVCIMLVFGGVMAYRYISIGVDRVAVADLDFGKMINEGYHTKYPIFNEAFDKNEEIKQALFDQEYMRIEDNSYAYFDANDHFTPIIDINVYDGEQLYHIRLAYQEDRISKELEIEIMSPNSIIDKNSLNIHLLNIIDRTMKLNDTYWHIDEERRNMHYSDDMLELRHVSDKYPTLVINELKENKEQYKQSIYIATEMVKS